MVNYQLPQPQTLGDIYSMNPGAFSQAQGLLDLGNQFAQQGLQGNQQELDLAQQMNPLRVQQQSLQNQTTQAQLPGIQAQSQEQVRRAGNNAAANEDELRQLVSGYKAKDIQNHIDQLNDVGTLFQQMGVEAGANPLGAAGRIRDKLKKAGFGDMWNPEWETMDPRFLQQSLTEVGQEMANTSQKVQQYRLENQARMDRESQLENLKQTGRMQLRNAMSSTALQIEAAKEKAKAALDKPTMEGLAGRYTALANQAAASGDMEKAQEYSQKANETLTEARALRAAGVSEGNVVKPNLQQLGGIPVNPPMAPPAIGGTPKPVAKAGLKYNSPEGQSWVQRAMQANPGMSKEQVLQQGRASGKIVD